MKARRLILLAAVAVVTMAPTPTPKYTTGPVATPSAADFGTANHVFSIRNDKWATHVDVANAVAGATGLNASHVLAAAALAGNPAALEGADIEAAIAACPPGLCEIDLAVGTYTDVCVETQRSHLRLIGQGQGDGTPGSGRTILKPYADPDNCVARTFDGGALFQLQGADDWEIAYLEADGEKAFKSASTTCVTGGGANFCGGAIRASNHWGLWSSHVRIHDVYLHDFIGNGVEMRQAEHWVVENSAVRGMGCVNPPAANGTACGCGAGDPGGCRGWNSAPDVGGGNRTSPNGIAIGNGSRNTVVRHNWLTDDVGHPSIEAFSFGSWLCDQVGDCPDNIAIEDNDVVGSIGLNGAQHVRIARNRVKGTTLPGGTGDYGVGILVTAAGHYDIRIEDNQVFDSDSSGIVVKPAGPGSIVIDGNILNHNCVDHQDGANLNVWAAPSFTMEGVTVGLARDVLIRNNIAKGSPGCTYALSAGDAGYGSFGGAFELRGGHYETGSSGAVSINNANADVRGLEVVGNLVFGAASHGIASALSVSGSITNTGGMCILTNTSTPIPASCVAP